MDRGQGEKAKGQKDRVGARALSPAPLHHSVHAPSTVTHICLTWLVPPDPRARGACGRGLLVGFFVRHGQCRLCSLESQGHRGQGGASSPDEPWARLNEVTLPLQRVSQPSKLLAWAALPDPGSLFHGQSCRVAGSPSLLPSPPPTSRVCLAPLLHPFVSQKG